MPLLECSGIYIVELLYSLYIVRTPLTDAVQVVATFAAGNLMRKFPKLSHSTTSPQRACYTIGMQSQKKIIWLFMIVGGALGGYTPLLWGGSAFSLSSVLLSAAGGILGIWVGFKLSR